MEIEVAVEVILPIGTPVRWYELGIGKEQQHIRMDRWIIGDNFSLRMVKL